MKKRMIRLGIGAVLFAAAAVLPIEEPMAKAAAFLLPYLIVGYKVLFKAVRNITYGKVFDENFLMAVASIGAFLVGEYPEAVAVMLFYQVGELFEDYAVGKSRRSIAELMNIRPDYANLKTGSGVKRVSPEEVKIGDIIVVRQLKKFSATALSYGSPFLDMLCVMLCFAKASRYCEEAYCTPRSL